jgi:hypothetical protein
MDDRRTLITRIALGGLGAVGLIVGAWAAFAPESFYNDFPGLGRTWVAVDGPYNEHLVRDVGQLFLAMTVVTAVAVVHPLTLLVRAVAAGWLVQSVPHFLYHLANADIYETSDQILNLTSLALAVVMAVVALALGGRRAPATVAPT